MTALDSVHTALRALPALPQVAQRILALVRDPEFAVGDLIALVRTDPALTGRVLKLCNSALFGLQQDVHAVADAVAWIGTRNLVKLVLVSCSATQFARTRPSPYADPDSLWRHGFATATAAAWLAARCAVPIDTAFTAGILHDAGKIVLSQVAARAAAPTLPPAADHRTAERAWFGLDHAAAAGIAAAAWQLPDELCSALRDHHEAAPTRLGHVLALADLVALQLGHGNPFPQLPLAPAPGSLAALGLAQTDLDAAGDHVTVEFERSAELLNLGALDCR